MTFASKIDQKTSLVEIFLRRDFVEKFDALFRLEEIYGALKLSPIYLKKINRWLNNDEQLVKQIKNQVTASSSPVERST